MDKAGEIVDGRGTYQIKKLRRALTYCASFRTAIDIGAHVGMWTMQLAKRFEKVQSFEPMTSHVECFLKNVDAGNVMLHQYALGQERKQVSMHSTPNSSGDTYVQSGDDVEMIRLDDLALESVDFVKLDCEGYEFFALMGGMQTIRKWRPVIIVEQKPGKAQKFGLGETDAVQLLESVGYRQAEVLAGDYIMVPGVKDAA